MSEEKCSNCGSQKFAIVRDMTSRRICSCGNQWPCPFKAVTADIKTMSVEKDWYDKVLQDVAELEKQLRAEKAGYSLLYDAKEQLRQEVQELNFKLEIAVKSLQIIAQMESWHHAPSDTYKHQLEAREALVKIQKGGE